MPPVRPHPPASRSSVLRRLLVLVTMSALAMVGWSVLPAVATATGPVATTTTLMLSPAAPALGDSLVLRALVSAASVPVPVGHVAFDAAPSEAALWGADSYAEPYPEPSDVILGRAAVGPDGIAVLEVRVTPELAGFIEAGTPFYLAGEYQPYELDGVGIYDQEYVTSTTAPARVVPGVRSAVPTTVLVTEPDTARAGKATTLTARVSPSSARGMVRFRIGAVPVGAPVPVAGGIASTSHTFTAEGTAVVTADFLPADAAAYVPSSADGRTVTIGPPVPRIDLSVSELWGWFQKAAEFGTVSDGGTLSVTSGSIVLLDAQAVLPGGREPSGRLTVRVDGVEMPLLPFLGVEQRSYTVTVAFESSAPGLDSVTESFTLVGGPPAPPTTTTLETEPHLVDGEKRVRATLRVRAADGRPAPGRVQLTSGLFGGAFGDPVRLRNGVAVIEFAYPRLHINLPNVSESHPLGAAFFADRPLEHRLSTAHTRDLSGMTWPTPAQAGRGKPVGEAKASLEAVNCAGGNTTVTVAMGRPGEGTVTADVATSTSPCGAAARAATARGTSRVMCTAAASGYTCPVGTLAAGTRFRLTGRFPMPATKAGRKTALRVTATSADPVTGKLVTLASKRTRVLVPRRTVLTAALTPTRRVTAVKRSKRMTYRVAVRNAGVVKAPGVRACVRLSAGAKVEAARGAKIRGRRACWTLPAVRPGRSVARTVSIRAPQRKGRVKVALSVVPPKALASSLRLTGVLPVR